MKKRKDRKIGKEDLKSIRGRVKPIKKDKVSKMAQIDEKKRIDMVKETGKIKPLFYGVLIIVVIAVIVSVVLMNYSLSVTDTKPIAEGDVAQIKYSVELQDGTQIDSGNFTFTVGTGDVITGVDNAVLGMIAGEKKTVAIPPEEGYGEYDPNNVMEISLVQEIDAVEDMDAEVFEMTFGEEAVTDELYQIDGMDWMIRVIGINNDTVTMRHEPEDGDISELRDVFGNVYGTKEISVRDGKINITSHPIEGADVGVGTITKVSEDSMTVDLNHRLAGETLIFEITLLNFISQ